MHNDSLTLIDELLFDIEAVQYSERGKIKKLQVKSIEIAKKILDPSDKQISKIKNISFEPVDSVFLAMSDQMHEDSWNSGKATLISLLNKVKDSLSSSPKVASLQRSFKNREKTMQLLINSLANVNKSEENKFLEEAIKCYEVGAWRASIIMAWNLTLNHLHEYVFLKELKSFNAVLETNKDRRVKITAVSKREDFSEIPENKFIEFCRSSNIISNDVKKILETKLGIRNTYAHPSNISLSESKVVDFIEDLVSNIILKFNLP